MAEFPARPRCGRLGGLAALGAATALGLAACGGSGSPRVAGPATNGGHGGGSPVTIETSGDTPPASSRSDPGGSTTRPGAGTGGSTTTLPTGGSPTVKPDPARLLAFSECMQANGFPDFPDPSGGNLLVPIGPQMNPGSPTFRDASRLCARKAGTPRLGGGPPPPGTIRVYGLGSPGGGPGPGSGPVAGG